ncbi:MAG: hypothetical protein JWR30_2398, partial [Conexibacter sp.]|nr:hypothetical protein [Conexibacter sp.]
MSRWMPVGPAGCVATAIAFAFAGCGTSASGPGTGVQAAGARPAGGATSATPATT